MNNVNGNLLLEFKEYFFDGTVGLLGKDLMSMDLLPFYSTLCRYSSEISLVI